MDCLPDIKDADRFLNVSVLSIHRWTHSRKLTCFRVGGKRERRFCITDLEGVNISTATGL
jgi:hypothetical protein